MTSSNPNDDFDDELLSAYVDDELSVAERAQVEARLRVDPHARQLVEELRGLSSAIRSLPRETLGRDLRASIQADILKAKADDDARKVLPIGEHNRWAGYRRGLIWSAITIAAALMLMVVQPEETQHEIGDVARADRKEKAARANRRGGVAADGALPPVGEMRAAAPQDAAKSIDAIAETPANEGAPSEEAAAEFDAFAAAAPAETQPTTIELALATPDAMAQFERLLSEHQIQLDAEPTSVATLGGDKQLADESSVVGEKERFARANEPLDAESSPSLELAADAGSEVLVEASPAQIDALVFACQSDKASFAAVGVPESLARLYAYAAQSPASAADSQLTGVPRGLAAVSGSVGGEAAGASAPSQNVESKKSAAKGEPQSPVARSDLQRSLANGRAWRLRTRGPAEAELEKLAEADARQETGALAKAPTRGAPQPGQVQVLFVLRPALPTPAQPAEPDP